MNDYGVAPGDEFESVREADTLIIHFSLFIIHFLYNGMFLSARSRGVASRSALPWMLTSRAP